ncbi:MAG: PAS domain S-box protein [Spirochaetes bacterium]|nr:PAS domain S-box protein [Spirochaetota bacterium]
MAKNNLDSSHLKHFIDLHNQLETNQNFLQLIFESISDWICLIGKDKKIIATNKSIPACFSFHNENVIDKNICELIHGKGNPLDNCPFEKMLKTKKKQTIEHYISNEKTWLKIIIEPVFDKNDNILQAVHVIQDITQQKKLERAKEKQKLVIQQENIELNLINELYLAANQNKSLTELFDLISCYTRETINSSVTLYIYDSNSKKLTIDKLSISKSKIELIEKIIKNTIPEVKIARTDSSILNNILSEKKTVRLNTKKLIQEWTNDHIKNAFDQKTSKEIRKILNVNEIIIVPLIFDNKVIGLMSISSGSPFTMDQKNQFEKIAIHLTNIIMQKKNLQLLKNSLSEKEILVKEVNHRVKNNLQIITSILELQKLSITDQIALSALQTCRQRVKTMVMIHDLFSRIKFFNQINFKDFLNNLANQFMMMINLEKKPIKIKLELEDVNFDMDRAVSCSIIINELLMNTYKYAFELGKEGNIFLKLVKEKEFVKLIYHDNGKGIPENIDIHHPTTLGLQLVHSLVQQIGGNISFSNDNGAKFTIQCPLS